MSYTITVNNRQRTVDVPEDMPLLWLLRDELGLVGTKYGCGIGLCGACTVHIDGVAQRACQIPVGTVGKSRVTTIEAVGESEIGKRVQQAWLDVDVIQCGYCQAGQIMSATALLEENPKPAPDEIDQAMAGNICRCATYNRIREAIQRVSGQPVSFEAQGGGNGL